MPPVGLPYVYVVTTTVTAAATYHRSLILVCYVVPLRLFSAYRYVWLRRLPAVGLPLRCRCFLRCCVVRSFRHLLVRLLPLHVPCVYTVTHRSYTRFVTVAVYNFVLWITFRLPFTGC